VWVVKTQTQLFKVPKYDTNIYVHENNIYYFFSSHLGILGGEVLTETSLESENLVAHKWDIVNKYYNTSIHLCKMTDRILLSESTAERIDALVIYFNSTAVMKD